MGHGNNNLDEVWQKARRFKSEPAPFLETRVLAGIRANKLHQAKIVFWRRAALTFGLVALVAVTAPLLKSPSQPGLAFNAPVGEQVAVRIEVEDLRNAAIEHVEVEVPDGVQFYSASYSEIAESNTLTLEWDSSLNVRTLPIVIKASEGGVKEVKVRFYNKNDELVGQRMIKIHFQKAS